MPQAAAGAVDAWGRKAATYPKVVVPAQVSFESESWPTDPIYWQRLRISSAAEHFALSPSYRCKGVSYAHHHIPEEGLNCSNYVAWVYNWAGIAKFLGDVGDQGSNLINNFHFQKILNWSELEMGDIIYLRKSDTSPDHTPTHAAIFIARDLVSDSMEERGGVTSHDPTKIKPTFQSRFEYGVRIINGEVQDGETGSAVQKRWCQAYFRSVLADFSARDQMPQDSAGKDDWGLKAATYPTVVVPAQVSFESESWPNDPIFWKRLRISSAAQHFEGVNYAHDHIPADGLDCSNYVAWVYNWAGIAKFLGDVEHQGKMLINDKKVQAQNISNWSELEMGDIIYLRDSNTPSNHTPKHAAIFIARDLVSDSMQELGGVTSHDPTKIKPTFQSRFEYGVRIIK